MRILQLKNTIISAGIAIRNSCHGFCGSSTYSRKNTLSTNAAITNCRYFVRLNTHSSTMYVSSDTVSATANTGHHSVPSSHSTTNAVSDIVHIPRIAIAMIISTLYFGASSSGFSSFGGSQPSCEDRR